MLLLGLLLTITDVAVAPDGATTVTVEIHTEAGEFVTREKHGFTAVTSSPESIRRSLRALLRYHEGRRRVHPLVPAPSTVEPIRPGTVIRSE
jgi:hypothetical protein